MALKQPKMLRTHQKFIAGDKKEVLISFFFSYFWPLNNDRWNPHNPYNGSVMQQRFSLVSLGYLWLYLASHVSSKSTPHTHLVYYELFIRPENVKTTYFVDLEKTRKFPLGSKYVVRHFKVQPRFRVIIVTWTVYCLPDSFSSQIPHYVVYE